MKRHDKQMAADVQTFNTKLTELHRMPGVRAVTAAFAAAKAEVLARNEALAAELRNASQRITQAASRLTRVVQRRRPSSASENAVQRRKRIEVARRRAREQAAAADGKNSSSQSTRNRLAAAFAQIFVDDASANAFVSGAATRLPFDYRQTPAAAAKSAAAESPLETASALKAVPQPPASVSERIAAWFETSAASRALHRALHRFHASNNIAAFVARAAVDSLRDAWHRTFGETEHAKALLLLRRHDAEFSVERFLADARRSLLPEFLDALLQGDERRLRHWTSEAAFSVLKANMQLATPPGQRLAGELFDLRGVELHALRVVQDDLPVAVVTCNTQQIVLRRDMRTGEIVGDGDAEKLQRFAYVLAIGRFDAALFPVTNGWKVVELSVRPL